MSQPRSERTILFLVGAVQFVNVVDFMMVMPLGPDFSEALGIPVTSIGLVGGAYTGAAALSGFAGAFFLDRFDRRTALAVAMAGLVLGTAAGGLATGLVSLLAARVLAGFFGGPATSVGLAIISDVVPAERRGKAMGAVMGAFSVASVLGVPAGLELARMAGWRAPFFAVAGLGVPIVGGAIALLPSMRGHLAAAATHPRLSELFARPVVRWSYLLTACVMSSGFMLIPNVSAYLQENLGYPRDRLGVLYMAGGVCSFVSLRVLGGVVDRLGAVKVATLATILLCGLSWFWFVAYDPIVPIIVLFAVFMVLNSGRNVAYSTLSTRVPRPHERARFMSIQSTVQHLAGAAGASLSSVLLVERADGSLDGMPLLTAVSVGVSLTVPLVMAQVARRMDVPAPAAMARS